MQPYSILFSSFIIRRHSCHASIETRASRFIHRWLISRFGNLFSCIKSFPLRALISRLTFALGDRNGLYYCRYKTWIDHLEQQLHQSYTRYLSISHPSIPRDHAEMRHEIMPVGGILDSSLSASKPDFRLLYYLQPLRPKSFSLFLFTIDIQTCVTLTAVD